MAVGYFCGVPTQNPSVDTTRAQLSLRKVRLPQWLGWLTFPAVVDKGHSLPASTQARLPSFPWCQPLWWARWKTAWFWFAFLHNCRPGAIFHMFMGHLHSSSSGSVLTGLFGLFIGLVFNSVVAVCIFWEFIVCQKSGWQEFLHCCRVFLPPGDGFLESLYSGPFIYQFLCWVPELPESHSERRGPCLCPEAPSHSVPLQVSEFEVLYSELIHIGIDFMQGEAGSISYSSM